MRFSGRAILPYGFRGVSMILTSSNLGWMLWNRLLYITTLVIASHHSEIMHSSYPPPTARLKPGTTTGAAVPYSLHLLEVAINSESGVRIRGPAYRTPLQPSRFSRLRVATASLDEEGRYYVATLYSGFVKFCSVDVVESRASGIDMGLGWSKHCDCLSCVMILMNP